MRYLFIVQGDGRGHLTQAIALSGILRKNGHEVVEVLVGKSKSREIPDFFFERIKAPVRKIQSPSFLFKKDKKHIHIFKTILWNIHPKRIRHYTKSIEFIHARIKKMNPDVVVNFYELLCGLAYMRFHPSVRLISIGHQFLIRHAEYPYAKSEQEGMLLFRLITLVTGFGSSKELALSFYPMQSSPQEGVVVVPPLLRKEVFKLRTSSENFILGYLLNPGYEEEVRKWHKAHPEVKLRFFWDNKKAPNVLKVDENLSFHALDDQLFLQYMATCKAYISTAGFESICEAFYLAKPVMMIPTHIEQEVNANDASGTGLGIRGDSFDISELIRFSENYSPNVMLRQWMESAEKVFLHELAGEYN